MKHFKYLWYVLRHKYFVGIACFRYRMFWRGIVHDCSKFLPDEWIAYVEFFYGEKLDQVLDKDEISKRRDAFDKAWLKHQHRNPHHWQHWILREDSGSVKYLEIPRNCVLEMLADWEGAGIAITGKREFKTWYLKNKEKILLHPKTSELVEYLLIQI